MIFYIEQIKIEVTEDEYGIRLKIWDDEWLLPGQSIAETKDTIIKNIDIVSTKYIKKATGLIPAAELNEVCLKIVVHYFYLYNLWRSIYEKEKERNLVFQHEDFTHPNTYDTIIRYFKIKYPNNYPDKCTAMLGIKKDAFLKYEAERESFNNNF